MQIKFKYLYVCLTVMVLMSCCVDEKAVVDKVPEETVSTLQEPVDAGPVHEDESVVLLSNPARFSEFLDLLDTNVSGSLEACRASRFPDYCLDHLFCKAAQDKSKTAEICSLLGLDPKLCVDIYAEACTDPLAASKGCGEYVVGEKDISICRATVAEFGSSQGLTKESMEVCGEISVDFVMSQCFTVIAVTNHDPDVCRNIGDERWLMTCFYETGLAYGDGEACGLIADEGMRSDCFEEIKSDYPLD